MGVLKNGLTLGTHHDGTPIDWANEIDQNRIAAGQPLPVAGLVQCRSDWQWLADCFRFRMWKQRHFCWMCDATLEARPEVAEEILENSEVDDLRVEPLGVDGAGPPPPRASPLAPRLSPLAVQQRTEPRAPPA